MKFSFQPNPEKKTKKKSKKYKLVLNWMHGDADHDTESEFESDDESKILTLIEKLFEYRKFRMGGYSNLGYYNCGEREGFPDLGEGFEDIIEYDITCESCPASLEKITLYIDGVRQVIIDHEARKQVPQVKLPKIGEIIQSDAGQLPTSQSKKFPCGRNKIPVYKDPENKKDGYTPIEGEVAEVILTDRYPQYDAWQIVFYVKEYDAHVAIQMEGVSC